MLVGHFNIFLGEMRLSNYLPIFKTSSLCVVESRFFKKYLLVTNQRHFFPPKKDLFISKLERARASNQASEQASKFPSAGHSPGDLSGCLSHTETSSQELYLGLSQGCRSPNLWATAIFRCFS